MTAEGKREELVAEVIRLRQEQELTQKRLEEFSGVKQPIIARMETGETSPTIRTLIKLLAPLGKTLYIGDLDRGFEDQQKQFQAACQNNTEYTVTKG